MAQPDTNRMRPYGKLGYVDARLVLTAVARTCDDAEKIARMAIGPFSSLGPWEIIEQHNELVPRVTIGDHQGPGWVVTAVFVRAEINNG